MFPKLGALSVADIDTGLVLKVIEPIWSTKTETASRLRRRIETILDWATVRGYRSGDNPARWAGHLREVLPPPDKTRQVKHHAALPFAELPAFMSELAKREGVAARALEFTILTAARTGETIGATWNEIDFKNKTWTVPADRMKGRKEHVVPLSVPAIEILRGLPREADFVFIGGQRNNGLSNMAMAAVLKRMGRSDVTVHGMRSVFSDWAHERTAHVGNVIEMALAHSIPSATEAAYRRGTLFAKRTRLMNDWARYCYGKAASGEVVSIRAVR